MCLAPKIYRKLSYFVANAYVRAKTKWRTKFLLRPADVCDVMGLAYQLLHVSYVCGGGRGAVYVLTVVKLNTTSVH